MGRVTSVLRGQRNVTIKVVFRFGRNTFGAIHLEGVERGKFFQEGVEGYGRRGPGNGYYNGTCYTLLYVYFFVRGDARCRPICGNYNGSSNDYFGGTLQDLRGRGSTGNGGDGRDVERSFTKRDTFHGFEQTPFGYGRTHGVGRGGDCG